MRRTTEPEPGSRRNREVLIASRRRATCSGNTKSTGSFQVSRACSNVYSTGAYLILDGVPHFTKRCAVTPELFNVIIEFRPSGTAGGLAERIHRESSLILSASRITHRSTLQSFICSNIIERDGVIYERTQHGSACRRTLPDRISTVSSSFQHHSPKAGTSPATIVGL